MEGAIAALREARDAGWLTVSEKRRLRDRLEDLEDLHRSKGSDVKAQEPKQEEPKIEEPKSEELKEEDIQKEEPEMEEPGDSR